MENNQSIVKIRAFVHGLAHTNVLGAAPNELVQALQNKLNVDENNVANVLLVAVLDKAQAVVDGVLTPQQMRDFFIDVAAAMGGTFDAGDEVELADSISKAAAQLSHITTHVTTH